MEKLYDQPSSEHHRQTRAWLRGLVPLAVCGAISGSVQAASLPVPLAEPGLTAAWPEQAGADSRELIRLSQWIRQQRLDVHSLLVVKDGKLIFERYSGGLTRDHNYELYSVTKGVTALAAGMLVDDGRAHLSDTAASVIGRWRPTLKAGFDDKQNVQLRHVLSMSTGLHYDFKPKNDPIYYGAPDRLKLAADTHPKQAPGSGFEYTDINPILAAAMLSASAGMPIDQYARQRLFEPLGMQHAEWDRADATGLVSSGWGLRLRPVDMAKIGELVLNDGKWQGRQLVSADWIRQMTTPKVAPDFGYYWWVNNVVKNEPEVDTMGFKGQFITVLPKRNTVIVMTSLMSIDGGLRDAANVQTFRRMVNDYILPALDNKAGARDSAERHAALRHELKLSVTSQGVLGTTADPTDTPRL